MLTAWDSYVLITIYIFLVSCMCLSVHLSAVGSPNRATISLVVIRMFGLGDSISCTSRSSLSPMFKLDRMTLTSLSHWRMLAAASEGPPAR